MHTNDLMQLHAEIAEAFDACLEDAFSRALASRAAADPRIAADLFEQLAPQRRDDRHLHRDEARTMLRRDGAAARRGPMADVIDVPFREVADPPRQA